MEKYINDEGKVGVLISPCYGGGWSTEIATKNSAFYAMDKGLVELKLKDASCHEVEKYIQRKRRKNEYGLPFGWKDATVEWLKPGTVFIVKEYDGYESLCLDEDILKMTA